MQLWHTGRISHPDVHPGKQLPVSASALKPEGQSFTEGGLKDHVTPRTLDADEIPGIGKDCCLAAADANRAGFDGVEVHSADNYLLKHLVRDSTNKRTDRDDGSIENRLRFPIEAGPAAIEAWGGPERVGIRLPRATTQPGGTPPRRESGRDLRSLSGRATQSRPALRPLHRGRDPAEPRRARGVHFADLRRRSFSATIANDQLTLEFCERELAEGRADLFSFGRPYIADPDFVHRVATGGPRPKGDLVGRQLSRLLGLS